MGGAIGAWAAGKAAAAAGDLLLTEIVLREIKRYYVCSAKLVLVSKIQFWSAKICFPVSKTNLWSANRILDSKLVFAQQVAQQIFARGHFLVSRKCLAQVFGQQ